MQPFYHIILPYSDTRNETCIRCQQNNRSLYAICYTRYIDILNFTFLSVIGGKILIFNGNFRQIVNRYFQV